MIESLLQLHSIFMWSAPMLHNGMYVFLLHDSEKTQWQKVNTSSLLWLAFTWWMRLSFLANTSVHRPHVKKSTLHWSHVCFLCLVNDLFGMEILCPHALHVCLLIMSMIGARGELTKLHKTFVGWRFHVGECVGGVWWCEHGILVWPVLEGSVAVAFYTQSQYLCMQWV